MSDFHPRSPSVKSGELVVNAHWFLGLLTPSLILRRPSVRGNCQFLQEEVQIIRAFRRQRKLRGPTDLALRLSSRLPIACHSRRRIDVVQHRAVHQTCHDRANNRGYPEKP